MNELFNKPLNQLTEEEKNQVQQFWNNPNPKKKPSVAFSRATLNDCVRPDGLALNIDYASVKAPTIHIPVDFPAPAASAHLCETLARIEKVWVLDNEKACRIVIDAILTEVLLNESNEQHLGYCEVKNQTSNIWDTVKSRMIGKERDSATLAMWTICLGPLKPNLWTLWTRFF